MQGGDAMGIDWDDLRLVTAIRDEGSAAGAARRLGIDQTTASRRLARLEHRLGLALFDRHERRLVARPPTEAIAADLEAVAATVERIAARLGDARSALTGTVTVSTVDLVATRMLAPALAGFRADHPGVRLVFDLDDANVSIAAREADVAIRLARPRADTALVKRLGDLAFGLYAPRDATDPARLPLAAYGPGLDHVPESRWLAANLGDVEIAFRADRGALLAEAIAAGHRGLLPRLVGDADARLIRLDTAVAPPSREIWSMVHPDRRSDRAVSAVVVWIETTIRAIGRAAVSRGRPPGSPA
jgi:DNA-binding transcriptional LysR family regulator